MGIFGPILAVLLIAGIGNAMATPEQREESGRAVKAWSRKWLHWPLIIFFSLIALSLVWRWLSG
jgi:hypothetical protein